MRHSCGMLCPSTRLDAERIETTQMSQVVRLAMVPRRASMQRGLKLVHVDANPNVTSGCPSTRLDAERIETPRASPCPGRGRLPSPSTRLDAERIETCLGMGSGIALSLVPRRASMQRGLKLTLLLGHPLAGDSPSTRLDAERIETILAIAKPVSAVNRPSTRLDAERIETSRHPHSSHPPALSLDAPRCRED